MNYIIKIKKRIIIINIWGLGNGIGDYGLIGCSKA